ncbi:MAG: hypothetical protein IKC97_03960 [Clostridia bacterium]|nr:hypothetical protein [Clostridia bacterium]
MSEKKQKKKKEKIIYIDDGRTIADMSGTSGGMFSAKGKKDRPKPAVSTTQTPWQTYCNAVKMMFKPMLVVIGIISLAFLLMYLFAK